MGSPWDKLTQLGGDLGEAARQHKEKEANALKEKTEAEERARKQKAAYEESQRKQQQKLASDRAVQGKYSIMHSSQNESVLFINPYTFLPLDPHEPQREMPLLDYDGHTGYLECDMEIDSAHSALFVPNSSRAFSFAGAPAEHKAYEFFSCDDLSRSEVELGTDGFPLHAPGNPVVPGSEVRGVVRNVYEQLTNSCLSVIDERNYPGQRSATKKTPYVLQLVDGEWFLSEAKVYSYDRPWALEGSDRKINRDTWVVKPEENCSQFTFSRNDVRSKGPVTYLSRVEPAKSGSFGDIAMLHVTGEIDNKHLTFFTAKGNATKLSKRLNDSAFAKKLNVSADVAIDQLAKTAAAYADKNSTQANHLVAAPYYEVYLQKLNDMRNCKNMGVECDTALLVYADESFVYLSPACFGKETFAQTVSQIAANQAAHDKCVGELLCPACRLFGSIGERSVGSRVRFSDAKLAHAPVADDFEVCTLAPLSGPKISSSEFYLTKPKAVDEGLWNYDYFIRKSDRGRKTAYMPEIKGRKVYWHHDFYRNRPQGVAPTSQNATVRLLKRGTFAFKVYFEDLSDAELRDLVFAIGGMGEGSMRKVGYGKPLGLGSVRMRVAKAVEQIPSLSEGCLTVQESTIDIPADSRSDAEQTRVDYINFVSRPLWEIPATEAHADCGGKYQSLSDLVSYPKEQAGPIGENNPSFEWFSNNRIIGRNSEFKQSLPTLNIK